MVSSQTELSIATFRDFLERSYAELRGMGGMEILPETARQEILSRAQRLEGIVTTNGVNEMQTVGEFIEWVRKSHKEIENGQALEQTQNSNSRERKQKKVNFELAEELLLPKLRWVRDFYDRPTTNQRAGGHYHPVLDKKQEFALFLAIDLTRRYFLASLAEEPSLVLHLLNQEMPKKADSTKGITKNKPEIIDLLDVADSSHTIDRKTRYRVADLLAQARIPTMHYSKLVQLCKGSHEVLSPILENWENLECLASVYNQRLVLKRANRKRKSGITVAELSQEGEKGLQIAIERHDHKRGVKFGTHATWWIDHSIKRAIQDKAYLIRKPAYLHKKEAVADCVESTIEGQRITDEEIAECSGLSKAQVTNARRYPKKFIPLHDQDEETSGALIFIPAEGDSAPDFYLRPSMKRIIDACLDEREALILKDRYGMAGEEPLTFEKIGERFKVTRECIRQIERRALQRIKAYAIREHIDLVNYA